MIKNRIKRAPNANATMSPLLQFVVLWCLVVGMFFICVFIAQGVITYAYGTKTWNDTLSFNLADKNILSALWIFQIITTTFPLFIVPVFFAFVIVREPGEYLKPSFRFPWILMLIAFLIAISSFPMIEWLSNINQKMVLPGFLKSVEDWMRETEKAAQKAQDAMLQMKTFGDMLFALFIVAFLTAIAEEFMFRGCLQTILKKWTKSTHAAIWITAILFSAFHLEFFGFLPRMFLGAMFGYLVVWSGSIWPAVLGHFINNGIDVVLTYLSQHKLIGISADDQHVFNSAAYIISFIILLFLFYVYREITVKKKPVQV